MSDVTITGDKFCEEGTVIMDHSTHKFYIKHDGEWEEMLVDTDEEAYDRAMSIL